MRRIAALALVVLFVAPIATGGAATIAAAQNGTATPTPSPTATPSPTPTATPAPTPEPFDPPGPYTYDDLEPNGVQLGDEAPTSVREFDPGEFMLVVQFPPNPTAENDKRLEPGAMVRGNKLRLETVRTVPGVESRNLTVVIVYWQEETARQNDTVVNYAANQSVQRVQVTVGTKWSATNVSLTPHFDGPVQATMWLEDGGQRLEGATWRFVHHSVESEEALPFNATWGGLFWWGLPRWGVSTFLGLIGAIVLGFEFPKRAGTGFNKGIGWWVFMSALVGGVLVAGWYADVVSIVVAAPYLLALPFAGLAFIVVSERYQPAHKGLFERPSLTETTDPTGDPVPDIEGEEGDIVHLVDLPGALGVVKPGSISAALARWRAGFARIKESDIPQRFPYGGDSNIAEKIYVESYEFKPAGWHFDFKKEVPREAEFEFENGDGEVMVEEWDREQLAKTGIVGVVGALVAFLAGGGLAVAFLAGIVLAALVSLEPHPSELDLELSPAHATAAKAARLAEEQTRLEFDTFEKVADHIAELETSGYEEVYKILEAYRNRREEALDELFGQGEGEAERKERPVTVGGDDD